MAHQPTSPATFEEAHDGLGDDGNALTGAALITETGHEHTSAPTISSIELVDTMGLTPNITNDNEGGPTGDDQLVSNIDGLTVYLVDGLTANDPPTRVIIEFADRDSDPATPDTLPAGAFQLKITFSDAVYPVAAAGEAANAAPTVAETDVFSGVTFIAAAANAARVNVASLFTLGTLTRVQTAGADTAGTDDDEYSTTEFLVPITVAAGILEAQLPISLWVTVAADQVYSLTALGTDSNGNQAIIQGRGNAAYSTPATSPFMVDDYADPGFTPTPPTPDTAGPDITAFTDPAAVDSDGNLVFTLTFDEALGARGLLAGDFDVTGGEIVEITPTGAASTYMVKVDPESDDPDETEVVVTLKANSVTDGSGNPYTAPATPMRGIYDNVNPTVSSVAGVLNANGTVTLSITFSEELGAATDATGKGPSFANADIDRTNSNVYISSTEPMLATTPSGNTTVWTLTVTPREALGYGDSVLIVIKETSIADIAGNQLLIDTLITWTRPEQQLPPDVPVVTIALPAGMTYIDSVDGSSINISSDIGSVEGISVSVTNGTQETLTVANGAVFVTPKVAATTVTVSVAANAVTNPDNASKGNVATSETFNVGPIFTIPAGNGTSNPAYLVITKTAGMTHSYLSDQPTIHTSPQQTNPPTPAPNISTAVWSNMPDLERLFNTASGNGGTLNIKKAATHPKTGDPPVDVGTGGVKITEVMWAIDESMRGAANDAEADDQWVEIENPNGHAVHVIIYARTGLDSAITHNGNPDGHIDRIGNAYNGGPGSAQWGVPGNNGNSYTGTDFVSMWRRYVENNRGKGYQNGTASGAWSASSNVYLTSVTGNPNDGALYNHKGTPGRLQSVDLPNPSTRAGTTNPPSSPFVINEVSNRDSGNARYEWIEIKNVTGDTQNLRNYLISVVTATDQDNVLLQIDNRDYNIPAGRVVLLLASDPRLDDDHPIAVGYNMDIGAASDQVDGLGLIVDGSNRQPPLQKVVRFERELPNDNNGRSYVLILRRPDNYEGHRANADGGKGVAETGGADIDKIVDIAGHHEGLSKDNYPPTTPENLNNTTLWPLVNFSGHNRPHRGHGDWNHRRHNALEVNRVRYRQHVKTTARNDAGGSDGVNRGGTGATHKDEGVGHYAFRDALYTGLGYKRTARIAGHHNGTPGYDGNAVGNTGIVKGNATSDTVTISEIMASTGPDADNPVLPQWIELYNSSPTEAANLQNWKLRFEMLDADGNPMDSLLTLDFNKGRVRTILPQQTVLIVAGNARQANSDAAAGTDVFNDNRVFNVFRDYGGANKFGANTRYMFFNPKAFNIALLDKDNKVVDAVGNLDGDNRTSDTNKWDYPVGIAKDGNRTSFIRVYDDGKARVAVNTTESNVMPVFGTGDKKMKGNDGIDAKWALIPAVNTEREFKITIRSTWYGVEDDYGTPNNRPGMVLPVELSHFRPTLEDGKVTIRWTTESELDNAGFNILRSDTRDGEYKQVNAELIEGAGTTGERNTYKWVDQTAKPGVVYYYQIEDVSFAGERQALAITKLKGLITAKNKLTTTWSELKASQ